MAKEHQFTTEEISLSQSLQSAGIANAMLERKVEETLLSQISSPSDLEDPAKADLWKRTMSFSRESGEYLSRLLQLKMRLGEQSPELLDRKIIAKLKVDERWTPFDQNLWNNLFRLSAGGDYFRTLQSNGEVPDSAKDTVSTIIECIGIVTSIFSEGIENGIFRPK